MLIWSHIIASLFGSWGEVVFYKSQIPIFLNLIGRCMRTIFQHKKTFSSSYRFTKPPWSFGGGRRGGGQPQLNAGDILDFDWFMREKTFSMTTISDFPFLTPYFWDFRVCGALQLLHENQLMFSRNMYSSPPFTLSLPFLEFFCRWYPKLLRTIITSAWKLFQYKIIKMLSLIYK